MYMVCGVDVVDPSLVRREMYTCDGVDVVGCSSARSETLHVMTCICRSLRTASWEMYRRFRRKRCCSAGKTHNMSLQLVDFKVSGKRLEKCYSFSGPIFPGCTPVEVLVYSVCRLRDQRHYR